MAECVLLREVGIAASSDGEWTPGGLREAPRAILEGVRSAWAGRNAQNCDVLLYAGTRFVRAHRQILVALSPFLRSLLAASEAATVGPACILLPDIRYADLLKLVEFIYLGEVELAKRGSRVLQRWLQILGFGLTLLEQGPASEDRPALVDADLAASVDPEASEVLGPLPCTQCSAQFQDETELKAHRTWAHPLNRFTCEICGQRFRRSESLQHHSRVHTGQKLKCQLCDKEFMHRRDLKDHMNVHTQDKVYLCHLCSLTFDTRKQLLNHRETHKGAEHPCSLCGKTLKNLASLRSHLRGHRQVANHTCEVCGRGFKRPFDLKVHARIHTGARPHVCHHCGKSFVLSSALARHRRSHALKGPVRSSLSVPSSPADTLLTENAYLVLESEANSDDNRGTTTFTIVQELPSPANLEPNEPADQQ